MNQLISTKTSKEIEKVVTEYRNYSTKVLF